MQNTTEQSRNVVSIWSWVGMILLIYGLIIAGMGIYYMVDPETATATSKSNPSLWWGCLMLASGVCFVVLARMSGKNKRP